MAARKAAEDGAGAAGRGGEVRGNADVAQMLDNSPAITIADLKAGDAIVVFQYGGRNRRTRLPPSNCSPAWSRFSPSLEPRRSRWAAGTWAEAAEAETIRGGTD